MRYSQYLAGLPANAQQPLANDLTAGAAWTALAVRRHTTDPSAAVVLGTIATAHAALRAALEGLGERDSPTTGPTVAPTDHTLPAHWSALVEQASEEMVSAWLQIAAEMARDAARSATRDEDVTIVREMLREALETLGSVRDDTLGIL